MSSPLAIAGVTRLLVDLLNNGLIDGNISSTGVGNVSVSALPPDRIETGENEPTQLNLFMYQTTPNLGWSNIGFPSLNGRGDRINNPPLALNLHYMLSVFGSTDLHCEILLGYAMHLFHNNPVLPREQIRNALLGATVNGNGLTPELEALQSTHLDEQIEMIKVTPEYMNIEELSKLWTSFQSSYRPSAFYKVTVVLIENYQSTKVQLPVLERNIVAFPFIKPTIKAISSRSSPAEDFQKNQKILFNHELGIEGFDLRNELVSIRIDKEVYQPDPGNVSPERIILGIPAELKSGIHGAQVVHGIMIGSPPEERNSAQSNVEAFVLSPNITSSSATDISTTGNTRSATVNLNVEPPIDENQMVILILNELGSDPHSYSFLVELPPQSPPGTISVLAIPIQNVHPGNYLVRIQVDGAESPLGTASNGQFNSPQIAITP